FSLGCVLYRMTTGQMPFPGKSTTAVLAALAAKDPEPPRAIDPSVPAALSDLIMECLAKRPQRRPESAAAVAEALGRIERDLAAGAAAPPPPKAPAAEEPVELSPEEVMDDLEVVEEPAEGEVVVARPKRKKKERRPPPARRRDRREAEREAGGLPWWVIVLIVLALTVIAGLVSFAFIRRALKDRDAAAVSPVGDAGLTAWLPPSPGLPLPSRDG
ncbi:MAG TPA: hypothetical protein VFA26_21030, partial [Gemmataceae bacterium]|nr:hypothetical protein [Gemmataceae bacterium]